MRASAMPLALVAAIAAVLVGCGSSTPSVPPPASRTPAPSTSAAPSPSAVDSPTPESPPASPAAPAPSLPVVVVPFPDDQAGRSLELTIVDRSGLVRSARAAVARDLALVDLAAGGAGVARSPSGGDELVVAWAGVVCDLTAQLIIPAAVDRLTIEEGLAPGCDLVPLPRGVVLTLAGPVASLTTAELVRNVPIEAIARSQAEAIALGYWGPSARVTGVRFARASDLDPRLAPPDRIVWAVTVDSGELPGSCPSLGPGIDPFPLPPCRAAASATVFLDAASGTYLGAGYGGS